jgi:hypothetical protein
MEISKVAHFVSEQYLRPETSDRSDDFFSSDHYLALGQDVAGDDLSPDGDQGGGS